MLGAIILTAAVAHWVGWILGWCAKARQSGSELGDE